MVIKVDLSEDVGWVGVDWIYMADRKDPCLAFVNSVKEEVASAMNYGDLFLLTEKPLAS
jgi:hypothetical protein